MDLVVNLRKEKYDVYIGRKANSMMHYGNPFSHLSNSLAAVRVATREQSILAYEYWLRGEDHLPFSDITEGLQLVEPERRIWILEHIDGLKDQVLGCFCAPLACHGDVLVRLSQEGS